MFRGLGFFSHKEHKGHKGPPLHLLHFYTAIPHPLHLLHFYTAIPLPRYIFYISTRLKSHHIHFKIVETKPLK